jgi:hypothetical protein
MSDPPYDWQADLQILTASSDEVVARVGGLIKDALGPRPSELSALAGQRDAVLASVRASFPSPFADGVQRWVEATERLQLTLGQVDEDRLGEERVSAAFGAVMNDLAELWRRLTSFLPFVFMTTVNRLDPDRARALGGRILEEALEHYERFYFTQGDQQAESERRLLLDALLRLFRQLDRQAALGPAFVLNPLAREAGGFEQLIPPRFDKLLLLLQQLRNRVQHDALAQRPPPVLAPLGRLADLAFLDILAVLRPICEAYQLVYVAAIHPTVERLTADGLGFSGIGRPEPVRLMLQGYEADAERVAAAELYLVRRGAGATAPLAPAEYLNLTPFLIYERHRGEPPPSPPSRDGGDLFVFREYRIKKREAVFNEFAGRAPMTVSPRDEQARRLLDAIEMFRRDLSRLVAGGGGEPSGRDVVFERTWQLSREHLACVMDPDRYDVTGTRRDQDAEAERHSFDEDLFIPPPEDQVGAEFVQSPRRGLVIAGPAGAGKSNLLCHWLLRARRGGRPALFLSGRLMQSAAFGDLLETVAGQIRRGWRLADLDAALAAHGRRLLLIVDAVNECSATEGAPVLLESILAFIGREDDLRQVQVILGCREELWNRYVERRATPRPLDPTYFHSTDALRLSPLEDEELRARLYAAYQARFRLVPESYRQLGPGVRTLIRAPLMMAVLAETYADRRRIPRQVDYYRLFASLTERKLADAQFLVPAGRIRDGFPGRIADALFAFAGVVYDQLSAAQAEGDALPWDVVDKHPALAPFAASHDETVAPLSAALEIGLLQRTFVTERTRRGVPRTGRVWRFFHDEYTQWWLSQVYDDRVLPSGVANHSAPAQLQAAIEGMRRLIEASARAPVLEGALDHWLYDKLTLPPRAGADLLLPILDRLSSDEAPAVRYYLRSFLAQLLRRGLTTPEALFGVLAREGGREVGLAGAELFLEAWRDLDPSALRACIEAPDTAHDPAIRARLADVFSHHFTDTPQDTLTYLDAVIDPVATIADLAGLAVSRRALGRQLAFLGDFLSRVLPRTWEDPQRGPAVRTFVVAKYRFVIDALRRSAADSVWEQGALGAAARQFLYPRIEQASLEAWDRFGTAMPLGGNDRFFVEDRGIVQRDLVRALLPYAVALHNGDSPVLSVARGEPLRVLLFRMLNHRVTSVVGALAATFAPVVLRGRWDDVHDLVGELAENPTDSGRFFANLLVAHLAYLDPAETPRALDTLRERILPWFAFDRFDWEWPTLFALCITDTRGVQDWPACRAILSEILGAVEQEGRPAVASQLGDHLLKACFLGEGELGVRVFEWLLSEGRLDQPLWHDATLKVAAGLLARRPALLQHTLRAIGAPAAVERHARRYVTDEVLLQRGLYGEQVQWDRAITRAIADRPWARLLMVRDIIGGLARARTRADIGIAVRRCVVNGLGMLFGDDSAPAYRQLTLSELDGSG